MKLSYKIRLSHNNKVITSVYQDILTPEEIHQSYIDRIQYDDGKVSFKDMKFMVGDYTNAKTINVYEKDLKKGIEILAKGVDLNPSLIVIGIMSRDLEFGLRAREKLNTIMFS